MMKIEKNYYNSILIFNIPPRPPRFFVIAIYYPSTNHNNLIAEFEEKYLSYY